MNAARFPFLFGAALCAALASYPARAVAADAVDAPAEDPNALGNHQKNVRVDLGLRTQYIKGSAYDAFSENNALNHLSLGASWAFWARDRWSLAGAFGFDYGTTSASLRSDEASLDVVRFGVAPEARYHLLRLLALTAKLGPTLTREAVSVTGGGLDTDLSRTAWRFGFDATAGAAVELAGYASGQSHKPRLWIAGEGGYGWTAPMKLNLKPEDAGAAPQRLAALQLGDLSVSGPLFRITAALSFW